MFVTPKDTKPKYGGKMNYWTKKEHQALRLCPSFEELGQIALGILRKMPQPVVEVCGPMSTGGRGSLEKNMELFQISIEILADKGYHVFDQIVFQDKMKQLCDYGNRKDYPMEILEIFYRKVFCSGYIKKAFFLPDWHTSLGATWEREFIIKLGNIKIEEFPLVWLLPHIRETV